MSLLSRWSQSRPSLPMLLNFDVRFTLNRQVAASLVASNPLQILEKMLDSTDWSAFNTEEKCDPWRTAIELRILKKFGLAIAVLIVILSASVLYFLRGGFRQFEITPYKVPPAAFTNWRDVLSHPRDISIVTFETGVVHMDACLNLDPKSPKQAECDHTPRDLAVLVHWVHHPRFGDFLIDTGFDNSFTKHPPYGNYTEAMKLFNWLNGVTNHQQQGEDLSAQLARLKIQPRAVFFTHLHPDHTGGVPALDAQNNLFSARWKRTFWHERLSRTTFPARQGFRASIFRQPR